MGAFYSGVSSGVAMSPDSASDRPKQAETGKRVLNKKEQQIEELLTPTIESLGCQVWGIEYLGQGSHTKLRIYIDRDEGISVDDCENVSRHVSDLLDVEDLVSNAYTLEVSSPGMDRLLFNADQYRQNIGQQIDVRLNFPFDGRRRITGQLTGIENDEAVVRVDDEEYVLPLENVHKARVVPTY